MPPAFQCAPQFKVVIDFAVKDDDRIAIFGDNRLIASREIDDFQAGRAQRDLGGLENALLIWPAMFERSDRALNTATFRSSFLMGKSGDAAHSYTVAAPISDRFRSLRVFCHRTCGKNSEESTRSWYLIAMFISESSSESERKWGRNPRSTSFECLAL